MKEMSLKYQKAMRFPFRNRWLFNLYIGLVQDMFQATAYMDMNDTFSFISQNANEYIFVNTELTDRVATFEQNLFRADGGSIFVDRAHLFLEELNQGVVSEAISDSNGNLNFRMDFTSKQGYKGLKGLTLYFDEVIPTSLTIKAYTDGIETFSKDYVNESDTFESFDVFGDSVDKLSVIINRMDKAYVRFRMKRILFGVGVVFDNTDIMSSGGSYRETFDVCSIFLPTKELNINLDNINERYNIDRLGSIVNLASIGQDISLGISYVHDDGTIERVPIERLELDSFDVSPTQLSIRAVDFLRNENARVEISPEQFPPNATLYDMAMIVKKSINNPTFTLELDDALKNVNIKPTHVDTTVKNALLMIASAGRCVMELIETGVKIKRVLGKQATVTFSSGNIAPYANTNQLNDTLDAVKIGTFENNYIQATAESFFPEKKPIEEYKVGYVSESLSNEQGVFDTQPIIKLQMDETVELTHFSLRFDDCTPKDIVIETYSYGSLVETYELKGLNQKEVTVDHAFKSFDEMRVIVQSIREGGRRVRVSHVGYGQRVYDLTYSDCREKPVVQIEPNIRNLIVNYHVFNEKDDTVVIGEVKTKLNESGTDMEYDNPFITDKATAQTVMDWLIEYYESQIFYDIPIIGDPSLQVNDIVRIPDAYNDNILGNIEMNEITFSGGGIKGKIKARREDTYVARTKAELATYRLYK